MRPKTVPTPSSLDDIEKSTRLHLEAEKSRPQKRSGAIMYGPLAELGMTWQQVYFYFRNQQPGGYDSFSGFMDKKNIVTPSRPLDDIAESAKQEYEATGKRPSKLGGEAKYGPLKDTGAKWMNIDKNFRYGFYTGFTSLAEFLDDRKIGNPDYTLRRIELSIRATMDETGKSVSKGSGPVLYGPIKDYNVTWENVDSAFRQRTRGLKYCNYKSLAEFRDARNIQSTLRTLYSDAAKIVAEKGAIPSLTMSFNKATRESIHLWERKLAQDAIKGWEFFLPKLAPENKPRNIEDFCLATGLARRSGETIRTATPDEIVNLNKKFLPKGPAYSMRG